MTKNALGILILAAAAGLLVWTSNGRPDPGPAESAAEVRNRLLAAIQEHTGGRPPDDDRSTATAP